MNFNGIIDCYEATNTRQDIPQPKYVQTQHWYSAEIMQDAIDLVNKRYGHSLRLAKA